MMARTNSNPTAALMEISQMELATAWDPENIDRRLALVRAYQKNGLHQAAEAELCRLGRKAPNHPMVLTATLDLLVDKRAWSLLPRTLIPARAVVEPPLELRMSLARACEVLGHIEEAASQYDAILNLAPCPEEALARLAEFIRRYPDLHPKLPKLAALAQGTGLACRAPALQYAALRGCIDSHPALARKLLKQVEFFRIQSVDVVLDLAIQAFRLGRWGETVACAEHALKLHPEHGTAQRLLVSGLCFQGRFSDARNCQRQAESASMPVLVSRRLLATVLDLAPRNGSGEHIFVLVDDDNDGATDPEIQVMAFEDWENEESPSATEGSAATTTVVMVHQAFGQVELWDTIVEAEVPSPLLVVQHVRPRPVLHALVVADEGADWPWEEVSLCPTFDATEDELNSAFEYFRTPPEERPLQAPKRVAFWDQVAGELSELPRETEHSDEW